MRLTVIICSFLFFFKSFSQTTNQEKIKNYIDTYFKFDREIIHVQFNKNSYVNTEDIGFKGFVFSRNNAVPSNSTANVQLIIYNEKQEIVEKQLLFSNKGTFSGGIHLSNKFKSGRYFFHFQTNWMNNFKEDDSFTQTIEIIDKNETYSFNKNTPNLKTAELTLFPEGGTIIADINNAVGVSIKDCNQKGIEIAEGFVFDSKSNEVSHFRTNKMGQGVFYFTPTANEKYTLKIKSNELAITQQLPIAKETGITVSYNNRLPNNKLLIVVKTNDKGIELYQNRKFYLLFQQNKNLIQQEINFSNKEKEQTLLFEKKNFSNGINSIRLIDENLNEICERLIYIYPSKTVVATFETKNIAHDSILLAGKTDLNQANLSISLLPENNNCVNQKRTIMGTFYLNAYLEHPVIDNFDYYDPENNSQKQDMELLLLNQKNSKFLWQNIKSDPPKNNFKFEKGITISGKVEKPANPNTKYKISLISFKDEVFDETTLDKDNNFRFENYYAKDSTAFVLQMVNEKGTAIDAPIHARISASQALFTAPSLFENPICPLEKNTDKTFTFKDLKFKDGTTMLKDVVIIAPKKVILTHKNEMSFTATAYKVREGDFGSFLNYLQRNGYASGIDPETGEVYIRSNRTSYSGDSTPSPSVYIDNELLFDFFPLFNLYLNDIDEIYIDKTSSSDMTAQGTGTIKIFLKDKTLLKKNYKVKFTTLIVTNGFTPNIKYKNSEFKDDTEFNYFGTLNWTPTISTDNLNFEIKFPKENQKQIQLMLEGFSDDGQLLCEFKKIELPNP